jgi:ATP-dependent Zn protease
MLATLVVAAVGMLPACASIQERFEMEIVMSDGSVPVAVPEPMQRITAIHEAAHAVGMVAYFPPGTVESVLVRTSCCGGDIPNNIGFTSFTKKAERIPATQLMEAMVILYAGREAEVHFFGSGHTDSSFADVKRAEAISVLYARTLVRQGADKDSFGNLAKQAQSEAKEAAKQLVARNKRAIRAVADAVLAQPEIDHARTLSGVELAEVLKGIPLVLPHLSSPR